MQLSERGLLNGSVLLPKNLFGEIVMICVTSVFTRSTNIDMPVLLQVVCAAWLKLATFRRFRPFAVPHRVPASIASATLACLCST